MKTTSVRLILTLLENAGDVARNESNIEIADGKYKGKRAKEIFSEVI